MAQEKLHSPEPLTSLANDGPVDETEQSRKIASGAAATTWPAWGVVLDRVSIAEETAWPQQCLERKTFN